MSASAILLENTSRPVKHVPQELLPDWMLPERTRVLTDPDLKLSKSDKKSKSSIVYWMQRDVRTVDNWALLLASSMAQQQNKALHVVYTLQPPPSSTHESYDLDTTSNPPPELINLPLTTRHGSILLGGLQLVYNDLKDKNIPFHVVLPQSNDQVGTTLCNTVNDSNINADIVICDFSPLRHVREWMEIQAVPLIQKAKIPFYQVDAHNVVPVWVASPKREYGARTIRSKINKILHTYLQQNEYPTTEDFKIRNVPKLIKSYPEFDMKVYESYLRLDTSVPSVSWAKPGTIEGMKQYQKFLSQGLKQYNTKRNDPNFPTICSNLSMWLNFGFVSFQRLATDTNAIKHKYPSDAVASFLEEGIIRRELSDNYVYYAPNDYDKLSAAYEWAQDTLQLHSTDKREYVYTVKELEYGLTHDDLWNAAQLQAVHDGKMHGFLRMYWAKKILEWTESPEMALYVAQYLNDKYNVDGRDPNGFVGVGWSIMGIHDQGWKEREVFGKIRFMNYNGCKRKFDVATFVKRYDNIKKTIHANIGGDDDDTGKDQRKVTSSSKKRSSTTSTKDAKVGKAKKKKTAK